MNRDDRFGRASMAGAAALFGLVVLTPAAVAEEAAEAGPVAVTVIASDATMPYGGALPVVTPSYVGLPEGTAPVTAPTCAADPDAETTSCAGAADERFDFSYVDGSLTVTPVPLTIFASDASWVDDEQEFPHPLYAGLVGGDRAPAVPPVCVNVWEEYVTRCAGAVDPHYVISYVDGHLTTIALGPPPVDPYQAVDGQDEEDGSTEAVPTRSQPRAAPVLLPATGK